MRKTYSIYLALLFIPLFFQSCFLDKEDIQGSLEEERVVFKGTSYEHTEHSTYEPSFNIGVIFFMSGGSFSQADQDRVKAKSKTSFNEKHWRSDDLFVSNSKDNTTYYNSLRTTIPNKAPSDFMSHISFMDVVEFVQKRSKYHETTITLNYLGIPLYAIYTYQLAHGDLYGGIGPYFAYGIGGNLKSTFNGQTTKEKAFGGDVYKRFDAGATFTVGYKIPESLRFGIAYDIGFVNLEKHGGDDKAMNRCISLNVSYPLDKIIKKIKNGASK